MRRARCATRCSASSEAATVTFAADEQRHARARRRHSNLMDRRSRDLRAAMMAAATFGLGPRILSIAVSAMTRALGCGFRLS
jgi:hypothetical protein